MVAAVNDEHFMSAAKASILRAAIKPIDPDTLVLAVTSEGIDEYFVRAALWSLLGRGRIQETENHELVVWN